MSSFTPSIFPRVRLTESPVPVEETKKIGHIYINGQKYRVSVIGTNAKNFKTTDETLIKAHMIAATKLKGDTTVNRLEVTQTTTKMTRDGSSSPTVQTNNDEDILDNKTLAQGAAIETSSYKKNLTEKDFQEVKDKLGTSLKVASVFSSIMTQSSSVVSDERSESSFETPRGRLPESPQSTTSEDDEDFRTPIATRESLSKTDRTTRKRTASEESAESIEKNGVPLEEDIETPTSTPTPRSSSRPSLTIRTPKSPSIEERTSPESVKSESSSLTTISEETEISPVSTETTPRPTGKTPVNREVESERPVARSLPFLKKPTPASFLNPLRSSTDKPERSAFSSYRSLLKPATALNLPRGLDIEMTDFSRRTESESTSSDDVPFIDRLVIERSSSVVSSLPLESPIQDDAEYDIEELITEDYLTTSSEETLIKEGMDLLSTPVDMANLDAIDEKIVAYKKAAIIFRHLAETSTSTSLQMRYHLIADYCSNTQLFYSYILSAEQLYKKRKDIDEREKLVRLITIENENIENAQKSALRTVEILKQIRSTLPGKELEEIILNEEIIVNQIRDALTDLFDANKREIDQLSQAIEDESTGILPDARELLDEELEESDLVEEDGIGLLLEKISDDDSSIHSTERAESSTSGPRDTETHPTIGKAQIERSSFFG